MNRSPWLPLAAVGLLGLLATPPVEAAEFAWECSQRAFALGAEDPCSLEMPDIDGGYRIDIADEIASIGDTTIELHDAAGDWLLTWQCSTTGSRQTCSLSTTIRAYNDPQDDVLGLRFEAPALSVLSFGAKSPACAATMSCAGTPVGQIGEFTARVGISQV